MASLLPWQTILKQFHQIKYVILNMRWLIVTALTQLYSSSNNIGSSAHTSSYSLCVYYVPGVPRLNKTWPSLEEAGLMSRWLPRSLGNAHDPPSRQCSAHCPFVYISTLHIPSWDPLSVSAFPNLSTFIWFCVLETGIQARVSRLLAMRWDQKSQFLTFKERWGSQLHFMCLKFKL